MTALSSKNANRSKIHFLNKYDPNTLNLKERQWSIKDFENFLKTIFVEKNKYCINNTAVLLLRQAHTRSDRTRAKNPARAKF